MQLLATIALVALGSQVASAGSALRTPPVGLSLDSTGSGYMDRSKIEASSGASGASGGATNLAPTGSDEESVQPGGISITRGSITRGIAYAAPLELAVLWLIARVTKSQMDAMDVAQLEEVAEGRGPEAAFMPGMLFIACIGLVVGVAVALYAHYRDHSTEEAPAVQKKDFRWVPVNRSSAELAHLNKDHMTEWHRIETPGTPDAMSRMTTPGMKWYEGKNESQPPRPIFDLAGMVAGERQRIETKLSGLSAVSSTCGE
mmetsp:Transcript_40855/g.89386  ORF Transcript_40855/g.89386 Transcript_40855/m.89386 type:complete len:259 (-) Transcript_40855:132-908(-)